MKICIFCGASSSLDPDVDKEARSLMLDFKNKNNDNWNNRLYDIGFIASCCNRRIKNIKLFKKIVDYPQFNNDIKIIIGKKSIKYSNIKKSICFRASVFSPI